MVCLTPFLQRFSDASMWVLAAAFWRGTLVDAGRSTLVDAGRSTAPPVADGLLASPVVLLCCSDAAAALVRVVACGVGIGPPLGLRQGSLLMH